MQSHSINEADAAKAEAKAKRETLKKAADERATADLRKVFLNSIDGKTLTREELEEKHISFLYDCGRYHFIEQLRDHYLSINDEEKTTKICHTVINALLPLGETKLALEILSTMPPHLMTLEIHTTLRSLGKKINKMLRHKQSITQEEQKSAAILLVIYNRTKCMQRDILDFNMSLKTRGNPFSTETYHCAVDELIACNNLEEALDILNIMPPVLKVKGTHDRFQSILDLMLPKQTRLDCKKFYSTPSNLYSDHFFQTTPPPTSTQTQPRTDYRAPKLLHHSRLGK